MSVDIDAQLLALDWILRYSVTADTELATLSNVCQVWRRACEQYILTLVVAQTSNNNTQQQQKQQQLLLLTSMAYKLINTKPSSSSNSNEERYCAAWFAPEYIQQTTVNTAESDDNTDDEAALAKGVEKQQLLQQYYYQKDNPDATTTDTNIVASDKAFLEQQKYHAMLVQQHQQRARRRQKGLDIVTCCIEWRGYREPMQVLQVFGYSSTFVNAVLRTVTESMDTTETYVDGLIQNSPYYSPTFAVRGATVARPESYCLCVDDCKNDEAMSSKSKAGKSSNNSNNSSSNDSLGDIRKQEQKEALRRREKRRREIQQSVLPLVQNIKSSSVNSSNNNSHSDTRKCVQFLNATRKHACCIMTPLFACGPLKDSVTIFLVAIAIEDGCFMSGIYNRYEVGHTNPPNVMAESTQLSPVCFAADNCSKNDNNNNSSNDNIDNANSNDDANMSIDMENEEENNSNNNNSKTNGEEKSKSKQASDDEDLNGDSSSSVDDDDEDEDPKDFTCTCVFKGVTEKVIQMDDDDASPNIVAHGRTIPGAWHCYTVIISGENEATIRVDGHSEPVSSVKSISEPIQAVLDGLTIGSDHCFDMSLCCGQNSDGGGDGSIAELAVFKGQLPDADILSMEQHLMQKHEIPASTTKPPWHHSELELKAQALLYFPHAPEVPQEDPKRGVPLHYLAKHRTVSWKYVDPVSNEAVITKKIGARSGGSSSEW